MSSKSIRATKSLIHGNRGFVSIIGLLVSLLIISVLAYQMMKAYFKPPIEDKMVAGTMAEQGINTSSYQGIVDSTRQMMSNITQQQDDYQKRLETIR